MNTEVQFELKPISTRMGVDELLALDERSSAILLKIRDHMLSPHPAKEAPTFSSSSLCSICDINKARLAYLISKGEASGLPLGTATSQGRSRQFSLKELRQWVRQESKRYVRKPEEQPAMTIAISNFKGGSCKTTTTMTLGQGLSLRGYKVLVVDLDPQASLTALFGLLPEKDVREEHTVMPYILKGQTGVEDLRYAVRPTYWDGLDIIPASGTLYGAEYAIPAEFIEQRTKKTLYKFWALLRDGIAPLLNDYDVVLFDTPPSLSYLTVNALMAADAVIMPLPPKALDFASSTQFWALFSDLANTFRGHGENKHYDFINVLLANVESNNAHTPIIRDWIQTTYDKLVLPVEIPNTTVAGGSATQFGTVYDVSKWEGNARTYTRARQAYDSFVDIVCQKLGTKWARQQDLGLELAAQGE